MLKDEEFIYAFNEWNDYHAYGFPYAGGRKDQPCQLMDIIKLFDSLYAKHRKKDGGK